MAYEIIQKMDSFVLPRGLSNGLYYLRIHNAGIVENIKILKK
jgi:hypothetical protein